MEPSAIKKDLRNFLDDKDRLTSYPAKSRLKIISLIYLASKFELGVRYTEREVNETLKEWHSFDDWAMLRRDMYDRRFMGREKNCMFYWLEEKQPTLADFGLEQI